MGEIPEKYKIKQGRLDEYSVLMFPIALKNFLNTYKIILKFNDDFGI